MDRKEVLKAYKGMANIQKELEKERARLKGSARTLSKHANNGTMPGWASDASKLFASRDYSYFKMIRLLRKNKVL